MSNTVSAKKSSKKTVSLADFHNTNASPAAADSDLSWAEDKHNPREETDSESKDAENLKDSLQREKATVGHAVSNRVFDFRNRDAGAQSQDVSVSGLPIPTEPPFILFLKNLPIGSVDSSQGDTTALSLEAQFREKLNISPVRTRIIVKGISTIAFVELSKRSQLTLVLSLRNFSFENRLLPIDVANESQRTDPDRLFDPFCSGPSYSPQTSNSSTDKGGKGGKGTSSRSWKPSSAASFFRRGGSEDGSNRSPSLSFEAWGSALERDKNKSGVVTTPAHSNEQKPDDQAMNWSFDGVDAADETSMTMPLAAPSSKVWRPSGKAVRFANESLGSHEETPTNGRKETVNAQSATAAVSGEGERSDRYFPAWQSSTPNKKEDERVIGSKPHRIFIGGLSADISPDDIRSLFELAGITVLNVGELRPARTKPWGNASEEGTYSTIMDVGDEDQLRHVLGQSGKKIKGVAMEISPFVSRAPPSAGRRGSFSSSSSRDDEALKSFFSRAQATESAASEGGLDDQKVMGEGETVGLKEEGSLGALSFVTEKTEKKRTTFVLDADVAPQGLGNGSGELCFEQEEYHDDCADNIFFYKHKHQQQFLASTSDYGGGAIVGEEEETNTVMTGYSIRGNASTTNKSTAANTFIGDDDDDYLNDDVEDSTTNEDPRMEEENKSSRALRASSRSSRGSADGRGRSASRTPPIASAAHPPRQREQAESLSTLAFSPIAGDVHDPHTCGNAAGGVISSASTALRHSKPDSPLIRSQTLGGSTFSPSNVATAAASSVGEDEITRMLSEDDTTDHHAANNAFTAVSECERHNAEAAGIASTRIHTITTTVNPNHHSELNAAPIRKVEFSIPSTQNDGNAHDISSNHIDTKASHLAEDSSRSSSHFADTLDPTTESKRVNNSSMQSSCGCTPPTRLSNAESRSRDDDEKHETTPSFQSKVTDIPPHPAAFNLDGGSTHQDQIVLALAEDSTANVGDNDAVEFSGDDDSRGGKKPAVNISDKTAVNSTTTRGATKTANEKRKEVSNPPRRGPPRPIAAASPDDPATGSPPPQPHPSQAPPRRPRWCVYVGNLPTGTTAQEVSDFFAAPKSKQGLGVGALVVRMRTNAKCTFAFVDVPSEEALWSSVKSSGTKFNGRPARIVPAKHVHYPNGSKATPVAPKPLIAGSDLEDPSPPADSSTGPAEMAHGESQHVDAPAEFGGMMSASPSLEVEVTVSPGGDSSSQRNTVDEATTGVVSTQPTGNETSEPRTAAPTVAPPTKKAVVSPPPPPPEAMVSVHRPSPSLPPSSNLSASSSRPSPPTHQQYVGSLPFGDFALPPSTSGEPAVWWRSQTPYGPLRHVNSYSIAAARARAGSSAYCQNAAVEALMRDPEAERVTIGVGMSELEIARPTADQCRHCVYVGNLPTGTTVEDVRVFFVREMGFSPLVVRIRSNEKSTFAFVDVSTKEELHHAIGRNGEVTLGNRPLRIRKSQTAY